MTNILCRNYIQKLADAETQRRTSPYYKHHITIIYILVFTSSKGPQSEGQCCTLTECAEEPMSWYENCGKSSSCGGGGVNCTDSPVNSESK